MHILCLICAILVFACMVLFLSLLVMRACVPRSAIKVKFSTFQKWYQLAPLKWGLEDGYVVRYESYSNQCVYFGFFGLIPYTIWKLQVDKREKKRLENKQMEKLLYSIQSDIDAVREESNRELQKARIMMEKIKHI